MQRRNLQLQRAVREDGWRQTKLGRRFDLEFDTCLARWAYNREMKPFPDLRDTWHGGKIGTSSNDGETWLRVGAVVEARMDMDTGRSFAGIRYRSRPDGHRC